MSNKAKDKTKESQILNAAAKHFAINGFDGARVDEIAAEAGVNKATLYYRIGDKAALYDRIFGDMLDNVLENIAKDVMSAQRVEDKFRAYTYAIAQVCNSNEYLSSFILREIASGGVHMSSDALEKMHQIRLALFEIIQLGIDKEEFKPINSFLVHMMLVGTLNFYSASLPIRNKISQKEHTAKTRPDPTLLEVAENISELVLNSIRINSDENAQRGQIRT
ncbi:MAG TPA: TetR/AcrR family transcriptional regulator [Gammaproteobacteria bacterium]|nr:TetR/AcrR family transcriptional regulator [Gammaproteobacteria bacterium]